MLSAKNASSAMAQSHKVGLVGENNSSEREVVVTLTLKEEAVAALIGTDAGTEQLAPFGAPARVSETVPLMPAPPMESA